MSKQQERNDDEAQKIQHFCSEAESHAEALIAPLRRTVEELDKLYDNIKNDSENGKKVRELCGEIDELIFSLKEMVTASSLEIEHVTGTGDIEEKINDGEKKEDNK